MPIVQRQGVRAPRRGQVRWAAAGIVGAAVAIWLVAGPRAGEDRQAWQAFWPKTDFARRVVPLEEIGFAAPRNRSRAIDSPSFVSVAAAAARRLPATEAVVGVAVNGDARAYPLRVLAGHGVINDIVGGVPIAVTHCSGCVSAVVVDRLIDGRPLTFRVSGLRRHADPVLFDRETESLWQRSRGRGLVGRHAGRSLYLRPVRIESLASFKARHPAGKLLVPNETNARLFDRHPRKG
jgi:hypothetical protein